MGGGEWLGLGDAWVGNGAVRPAARAPYKAPPQKSSQLEEKVVDAGQELLNGGSREWNLK